jgi:hypothetical protein
MGRSSFMAVAAAALVMGAAGCGSANRATTTPDSTTTAIRPASPKLPSPNRADTVGWLVATRDGNRVKLVFSHDADSHAIQALLEPNGRDLEIKLLIKQASTGVISGVLASNCVSILLPPPLTHLPLKASNGSHVIPRFPKRISCRPLPIKVRRTA